MGRNTHPRDRHIESLRGSDGFYKQNVYGIAGPAQEHQRDAREGNVGIVPVHSGDVYDARTMAAASQGFLGGLAGVGERSSLLDVTENDVASRLVDAGPPRTYKPS